MSLLRFFRFRGDSSTNEDNIGPTTSDSEQDGYAEKGSNDDASSAKGVEITTVVDPDLNPGELTFEEGMISIGCHPP